MKITQKRTCVGCRAYERDYDQSRMRCGLGYGTEIRRHKAQKHLLFLPPIEPCPKPLTFDDLHYAEKWLRAEKITEE
ncbi:MAG: hypothetical protein RQ767_05235 [Thermovirgaceae bacterium]|nr:hypothetical protein [Thermovirgaceae bacterium]